MAILCPAGIKELEVMRQRDLADLKDLTHGDRDARNSDRIGGVKEDGGIIGSRRRIDIVKHWLVPMYADGFRETGAVLFTGGWLLLKRFSGQRLNFLSPAARDGFFRHAEYNASRFILRDGECTGFTHGE